MREETQAKESVPDAGPGSFIEIDKDNLDVEWVGQPEVFYQYARKLADADFVLSETEAVLDVTDATVASDVRQDPGRFGLIKPTEAGIKAATILDPRYARALAAVNKAKHRRDIFKAAVTALEHRKRALEGLVTLHGQDYFSAPRAPKAAKEAAEHLERKANRVKPRPA